MDIYFQAYVRTQPSYPINFSQVKYTCIDFLLLERAEFRVSPATQKSHLAMTSSESDGSQMHQPLAQNRDGSGRCVCSLLLSLLKLQAKE